MNDFTQSVCLITNELSGSWGSGFSIYQEDGATYVVTCAHVIGSSQENILVNGKESDVVAIGEGWIDIAVLKVRGLEGKPPLKICNFNEPKRRVKIPGISKLINDRALRVLNGILGDPLQPMSASGEKVVDAWDLKLDDGEYAIKEGYSGSPVIDVETNGVIGIVSHRVKGEKGIAIAIQALSKVWKEIPYQFNAITPSEGETEVSNNLRHLYTEQIEARFEQLNRNIATRKREIERLEESIKDLDEDREYIKDFTSDSRISDKQRKKFEEKRLTEEKQLNELVREWAEITRELEKRNS